MSTEGIINLRYHGTVIFSDGRLNGGSAYTGEMAKKHNRPCLHIDLNNTTAFDAAVKINSWTYRYNLGILNVTVPRSSISPKIYESVRLVIKTVIRLIFAGINDVASFEGKINNPPQTVEEAVDRLINELPLKDKTLMAKMKERELPKLHHDLGMDMQKNFKLWSGNVALLSSCESVAGRDDVIKKGAAAVIIKELWKKLKDSHILRVVK